MTQKPVNNPAPEVLFSLRLDPSLKALLDSAGSLHEQVRSQIAKKLGALLESLGTPAKVSVTIDSLNEETASTGKFLSINLNGNPCLYPTELLQLVHSYVTGVVIDPNNGLKQILEWLNELSSNQSKNGEAGRGSISEFLSLACLGVISRQPATVLSYEQAVAYCASLPKPTDPDPSVSWPPNPTWLLPILQGVLALRISIADKQTVAQIVHSGLKTGRSQQDVIEDLIKILSPDVIEIQLPEEYLRQLTLADVSNAYDSFTNIRDDWYSRLGIHFPRFQFVTVQHLRPNSCAFKLNHVTTLPCVVLAPDECLTDGTDTDLEPLNVDFRPTFEPLTGIRCSVIKLSDKPKVEEAGMFTLNQMTYVARCLAVVLKERVGCFIDSPYVDRELEKLEELFPKLVEAVRARITLEQITRILRSLVAEDICIRDLRSILESQLDYFYCLGNSTTGSNQVWANDATMTSFVRIGLKCHISHKYARNKVLTAYVLDPEIEKLLAKHEATGSGEAKPTSLDESQRNQILTAIQAQLKDLSFADSIPLIVTKPDLRHRLREIITQQFPNRPVLAYQEISPHVDLNPVSSKGVL